MLKGFVNAFDWLNSAVQHLVDFVTNLIAQNQQLLDFFVGTKTIVATLWSYLPTSLIVIGGVALAYWVIMLIIHGGAQNG